MPETLVINASPLIFLGNAGQLDLLRLCDASRFVVPSAVLDEITLPSHSDRAARSIAEAGWIERGAPVSIAGSDRGGPRAGESAVAATCLELRGARPVSMISPAGLPAPHRTSHVAQGPPLLECNAAHRSRSQTQIRNMVASFVCESAHEARRRCAARVSGRSRHAAMLSSAGARVSAARCSVTQCERTATHSAPQCRAS